MRAALNLLFSMSYKQTPEHVAKRIAVNPLMQKGHKKRYETRERSLDNGVLLRQSSSLAMFRTTFVRPIINSSMLRQAM
jgi:hypothetical protein